MLNIINNIVTSKKLLLTVFVAIAMVMSTLVFTTEEYKSPDYVRFDMTSYYGYLPAFFIHHDLSLKFNESLNSHYFSWCALVENGKVFRSTMGVSIMLLPFYGIAEVITWLGDFERTGFTSVYFLSIAFAPIFYLLVGLWFISKTLKEYVSEGVIALSTVALVFATNIFYYVVYEGIMSHIYSFSLYAIFVYAVVYWHRKPSLLLSILMGFSFGMLVLIRPIHAVSFFFFLLYDVQHFKLKFKHIYYLLTIGIMSFLCVLPQMVYWKIYSGSWIFYTYGEEGFFFLDSKFLNGLFSFRSGWLVYTPIMSLSLWGIYSMYKEWRTAFWAVLVFSVFYLYVVYSWWCWWYGASFSSRSMVDVYPVFAIPLAVAFKKISRKYQLFLCIVIALFSVLNIFQSWQYNKGIIHYEGMNSRLYFSVFGATDFPNDYVELRSYPNYNEALKGKRDE